MSFTFEPFAETPEYIHVNRRMVTRWLDAMVQKGVHGIDRLFDFATGVGTMVQLFLEGLPESWRPPVVTCVDSSKEALALARSRLKKLVKDGALHFICSPVETLPDQSEQADVVIFGNGIHYLNESGQLQVLSRIHKLLKPGGWFFFNTAFYKESRPESTLPFYQKKVKLAVLALRKMGISREKGVARPAAGDFLPRRHYEEILKESGFRIVLQEEMEARLGRQAWEYISGYSQYAAGALYGFPLEAACAALKSAVAPALEEHGQRDEDTEELFVPRHWLSLAAVRA